MIYKPNFFIITGGPGAGKTTLLEQLQQRGYTSVPEVARDIIREQIVRNENALPWGDIPAYIRLMLSRSIDSYLEHISRNNTLFFDRGIPDTLAYAHLTHQPISPDLQNAALSHRYNSLVFILPPWEEIYHTDTERKQSYQEAIDTYNIMYSTYQSLGYTLSVVPKTTPGQRADHILQSIAGQTPVK